MDNRTRALEIIEHALQICLGPAASHRPSAWLQLPLNQLLPDQGDLEEFLSLVTNDVAELAIGAVTSESFDQFTAQLSHQENAGSIVQAVTLFLDTAQTDDEPASAPAPPSPAPPIPLPSPSAAAGEPPQQPEPDTSPDAARSTAGKEEELVEGERAIDRNKASRDTRIVDEAVVGKQAPEYTEETDDTIGHTQVSVEPLPSLSAPPSPPPDGAARRITYPGQTSYPAPAANVSNASVVRIFYATDRFQLPSFTGDPQYDSHRSLLGKLHYGDCEISIPKTHRTGHLEGPSLLRFEFRPDPEKHIVLAKTRTLEEQRFFEEVRTSVSSSAAKDAFVFIHGYNVSFANAARRTGQIAYDLNFRGAPIFYSWPSNGRVADYLKDETNITWSAPHLETFLTLLSQRCGAERIHLIAHSMGNRAVCEALRNLSREPESQLRLTHLVLAAPDIDAETFSELASNLEAISNRVTLYESSNDKAIHASRQLHGNSRAGEPLLVLPGLDTIDVSAIDTDFLGHSYFSDNWPLLSDIHSLIANDEAPSSRFGLTATEHSGGRFYTLRP